MQPYNGTKDNLNRKPDGWFNLSNNLSIMLAVAGISEMISHSFIGTAMTANGGQTTVKGEIL